MELLQRNVDRSRSRSRSRSRGPGLGVEDLGEFPIAVPVQRGSGKKNSL